MNTNLIYWLRWIFILPGALIIGFLATFPLHWILYLIFGLSEEAELGSPRFFLELLPGEVNMQTVEYILYPVVIAATFVIVGSKIAPRHKFMTALVLFGIYVGVWIMASIFSSSLSGAYNVTWGRGLFALLGATAGLFQVRRDNKDEMIKDIL